MRRHTLYLPLGGVLLFFILPFLLSAWFPAKSVWKKPVRHLTANPNHPKLPVEQLKPGDILLWKDTSGPPVTRFVISILAKEYTHAALYLGEADGKRWIYESKNLYDGVVVSELDKKWFRSKLHVSAGRVNNIPPAQLLRARDQFLQIYGHGKTPYHAFPPYDKFYVEEGIYCGQVIWLFYKAFGIDLDSNDPEFIFWYAKHNWWNPYSALDAYVAVYPDEIYASPHIEWYYDKPND